MNQELTQRLALLRERMKQMKTDAYIISSEEDIWYYTNITYRPEERPFLVIVSEDDMVFIVPKLEEEHVKKGEWAINIHAYWEYPSLAGENWYDVLQSKITTYKHITVEDNINAKHYAKIQHENKILGHEIAKLRCVKSSYEIEQIRNVARIASDSMQDIFQQANHQTSVIQMFGVTQKPQMELLQQNKFNPENSSLLAVVWPAPESAMPHSIPPIFKTCGRGPHVAMTYYRINGYAAECERTFFIGEPTPQERFYFTHMMEARRRALAVVRAGAKTSDVDEAAMNYLKEQDLHSYLLHRTGHGIGLSNHEAPFIAQGSEEILEENMIISIEPGIYVTGVGGFRHSDTVLVTKDGYELLTTGAIELEQIIF